MHRLIKFIFPIEWRFSHDVLVPLLTMWRPEGRRLWRTPAIFLKIMVMNKKGGTSIHVWVPQRYFISDASRSRLLPRFFLPVLFTIDLLQLLSIFLSPMVVAVFRWYPKNTGCFFLRPSKTLTTSFANMKTELERQLSISCGSHLTTHIVDAFEEQITYPKRYSVKKQFQKEDKNSPARKDHSEADTGHCAYIISSDQDFKYDRDAVS